ncbi:RNA 3'-terminal phosphate cyclase [Candidatus Moduliflexus flocculans]|uniref:RNA 3'-terminal phosphate cyclase n=1 Tax=Candidatus Moduliflexus flocculans TaxID=1499966 RepID=A0A081BQ44_9BACT|nr:RNA 3'-terminal phosphate cyclase [Candidatus Moduliflexus flocculans]
MRLLRLLRLLRYKIVMRHDIEIDGSFGEGGGQILRTSLALSLVTGKPFRMERIRANRKRPGLARQHLTAVNAAAIISNADVSGNALESQTLTFAPQQVIPGDYHFAVGTAGNCTLVLQTVLPALLTIVGESRFVLEGGTHNPLAPSFDFLEAVFLPILGRMGANVSAKLDRPGFYPAGGGKMRVTITSSGTLKPLELLERGAIVSQSATALLSELPAHIGERELKIVKQRLGWPSRHLRLEEINNPVGPGNALTLTIVSEQITELFAGFGERGVRAETVAERVVNEAQAYLDANVPVGAHLADQLLIPFALAGGGRFRTLAPTLHTTTNIEILKHFLDIDAQVAQVAEKAWEITLHKQ